jgi:hypothetical protein
MNRKQVMADEDIRRRFLADGADPVSSRTLEGFAGVTRSELVKWAQVARAAKIEPQ